MTAPFPTRLVAGGSLAVLVGLVPAFVLGATGGLARDDLQIGQPALGGSISLFFALVAAVSVLGGRLADRFPPTHVLLASVGGSALGTAGIALHTPAPGWLFLWMGLTGAMCGITIPTASVILVRGSGGRGGSALAIQQSASPAAALIGGSLVPTVALTVGWRPTFLVGPALAALTLVVLPHHPEIVAEHPTKMTASSARQTPPLRAVLLAAVAAACGGAVAVTTTSFFVETATRRGLAPGTAGLVLALGGIGSIVTRLTAGLYADRHSRGHLRVVGAMFAGGALGQLILSLGQGSAMMVSGFLLAYAIGYSWPGLMFHGVSAFDHMHAGRLVGSVNTGGALGSAMGPLLFGVVASGTSDAMAWFILVPMAMTAAWAILASASSFDAWLDTPVTGDRS